MLSNTWQIGNKGHTLEHNRIASFLNGWNVSDFDIQDAIDKAALAGGGKVYVPPGTYTTSLTMRSNVALIGAGAATVIYIDSDEDGIVVMRNTENIYIGNLKLLGNGNAVSPGVGRGAIHDYGSINLIIENLWIENVNTCGLMLGSSVGITQNIIARNVHIKNTWEHGVYLAYKDGAVLSGVIVRDAGRNTEGAGIKVVDSINVTVSDCISTGNNGYAGITAHASTVETSISHISISNCIAKNPTASAYGLYIHRDASDISINGGYYEGDYGVRVNGEGEKIPARVSLCGVGAKGFTAALDVVAGDVIQTGCIFQGAVNTPA